MATYIVGDIQGCFKALTCLLDKVQFDPKKDCLCSVGDIVNRGPDSLETIRFLKSLGNRFKMVLGNHDLHLIAVAYGASPGKKGDSLDPILQAPDRQELIDWLRKQPLVIEHGDYLLVHAGIPHIWNLQETLDLSHEVERELAGQNPGQFLEAMYGNEPSCWSKELTGMARLRIITNYLTRMRICTPGGALNLSFKGPAAEVPEGFLPWFKHYSANPLNGKEIFFGHWAALTATSYRNRFHALDSGCVWGGKLTFYRLEDKKRFTCACA